MLGKHVGNSAGNDAEDNAGHNAESGNNAGYDAIKLVKVGTHARNNDGNRKILVWMMQ